jgi:hypothetical protein
MHWLESLENLNGLLKNCPIGQLSAGAEGGKQSPSGFVVILAEPSTLPGAAVLAEERPIYTYLWTLY